MRVLFRYFANFREEQLEIGLGQVNEGAISLLLSFFCGINSNSLNRK